VAENVEKPSEWVGERVRAYMDPAEEVQGVLKAVTDHGVGRWSGGFILWIGRLSTRITRRFLLYALECVEGGFCEVRRRSRLCGGVI
jgi:hypothetical protein